MANLTEKRLKEMEEEMNRFEEEILSTKAAAAAAERGISMEAVTNSRKIIGAGTYRQVQAEIASKTSNSSSRPNEELSALEPVVAGPLLPPPPPPLDSHSMSVTSSNSSAFNLRPPPPPPGFMGHQMQHRPMPPPRPPFPMRGMQPGPPCQPGSIHTMSGMMASHPNMINRHPVPPGGFVPHHIMQMNMGNRTQFRYNQNSGPPTSGANTNQTGMTMEKPKLIYAAAPVKRVIMEDGKKEVMVEPKEELKKARMEAEASVMAAKKHAVPGIELNVPVEEIEAEKKLHFQTTPMASGSAEGERELIAQDSGKKKEKKKKFVRMAAGTVWEDQTLNEWEQDDFRLFCGDLGNEVTDETLARAFSKYPTFLKAKVVRDKRTNKTKGFGFVSFKDPNDFMKAMREMNGKYVGNRPIKLRKSAWRDRQIDIVKKKDKEKKRLGFR